MMALIVLGVVLLVVTIAVLVTTTTPRSDRKHRTEERPNARGAASRSGSRAVTTADEGMASDPLTDPLHPLSPLSPLNPLSPLSVDDDHRQGFLGSDLGSAASDCPPSDSGSHSSGSCDFDSGGGYDGGGCDGGGGGCD